jgi:integrase
MSKTLAEAFAIAARKHFYKPKFVASNYARDVRYLWENNISPRLGSKSLDALTPQVIHKFMESMEATPYTANRAKAVLSKTLKLAMLEGLYPLGPNPCNVVPNFPEEKRNRYATHQEIAKIHELLAQNYEADKRAVTFLYVLLYTGARPSSIERALAAEFRVEDGVGIITRQGKTGVEKVVVPRQAAALIEGLPPSRDGRLIGCKMPVRLWAKIRKEAGCPDLRARDLRRTFATVGMSAGLKMDQISEILGHRSTQTTKIYAKLNIDSQIESARAIADAIEKVGA